MMDTSTPIENVGIADWGRSGVCPDSPTKMPYATSFGSLPSLGASCGRHGSPAKEWVGCSVGTQPLDPLRYDGGLSGTLHETFASSTTARDIFGGVTTSAGCPSPTAGRRSKQHFPPHPPSPARNSSANRKEDPEETTTRTHQNPFSPSGFQIGSRSTSPALRGSPCCSVSPGRGGTPVGSARRMMRKRSVGAVSSPGNARRREVLAQARGGGVGRGEIHFASPCTTSPHLAPRLVSADQDLFTPIDADVLHGSFAATPDGSMLLQRVDTVAMLARPHTPPCPQTPETHETLTPRRANFPAATPSVSESRSTTTLPPASPAKGRMEAPPTEYTVSTERSVKKRRQSEFVYVGVEHDPVSGVERRWRRREARLYTDTTCDVYKVRRKLDGMHYALVVMKEAITAESAGDMQACVAAVVASQPYGAASYIDSWKETKTKRSTGVKTQRLYVLMELMYPTSSLKRREFGKVSQRQLLCFAEATAALLDNLHAHNLVHTAVSLDSVVVTHETNSNLKLGLFHTALRYPEAHPKRAKPQQQRLEEKKDLFLLAVSVLELMELFPFKGAETLLLPDPGPHHMHTPFSLEGSSDDGASPHAVYDDTASTPSSVCSVVSGESGDDVDMDLDMDDAYHSQNVFLREAVSEVQCSDGQWKHFAATCVHRLAGITTSKGRALPRGLLAVLSKLICGEVVSKEKVRHCQKGASAYLAVLENELVGFGTRYEANGSAKVDTAPMAHARGGGGGGGDSHNNTATTLSATIRCGAPRPAGRSLFETHDEEEHRGGDAGEASCAMSCDEEGEASEDEDAGWAPVTRSDTMPLSHLPLQARRVVF